MRLIDADAIQIPKTGMEVFETCRLCETAFPKVVNEIISNAPTIEPKRGKWVRAINDYDHAYHNYCSLCKEWNGMDVEGWNWTPNFCPNCGADMRGDNNE